MLSFSMIACTICSTDAAATSLSMRADRTGSAPFTRSTSVGPPRRLRASAAFIICPIFHSLEVSVACSLRSFYDPVARLVTFLSLFGVVSENDPRRAAFFPKGGETMLTSFDRHDDRIRIFDIDARCRRSQTCQASGTPRSSHFAPAIQILTYM